MIQILIFIYMFRSLILAVVLLLCIRVNAQIMPFRNYGIKDGLSDNNVQAVIRDNRGLLWVGTDFGIYWFDGAKFYRPPIKANVGQLYITGFYKDFKGTIWVMTFFNGIFKYENGRFTDYMPDPGLKDASSNSIADMTELCPGKYLIVTQNRPFIFDGTKFSPLESEHIFATATPNCVTRLPDKTTALGTEDGLFLLKYEQNRLVFSKHLLPGIRVAKVAALDNNLWALTDKQVLCYKYQKAAPFLGKLSAFLINRDVKDIIAGKNGEIWATSTNGSFWDVADTVFKMAKAMACLKTFSRYTPMRRGSFGFPTAGGLACWPMSIMNLPA
jgi:ligand-binding sensor domain-containing protein